MSHPPLSHAEIPNTYASQGTQIKLSIPADPGQQTLTVSSASDLHFFREKGIFNLDLSTIQDVFMQLYEHS